MDIKDYVASIPDFPIEGILFRDITPLMADGEAFHQACEELIEYARKIGAEVVVGPESRGFIFGCPVAHELHIGFVPVRKPNKLQVIVSQTIRQYGHLDGKVHSIRISGAGMTMSTDICSILRYSVR